MHVEEVNFVFMHVVGECRAVEVRVFEVGEH